MNILLTGASGFVGQALAKRLAALPGARLRLALHRTAPAGFQAAGNTVAVGDLARSQELDALVQGIDVVIHAAARVHVMHERSVDPLSAYRATNVQGTARLAESAARAGIHRFIYLSSVKAHGEMSPAHQPFTEDSPLAPQDAYGQSKAEAEEALRQLAQRSGLAYVVIRPPLVYGPGVGANFRALMRAIQHGLPLPLGALQNRRSLVALDNLCDFIALCAQHPAALGQGFEVSDGEDLSTPELVRALAQAMGRPARLLAVPAPLMRGAATLCNRQAAWQRLSGNLQVDITKARTLLGWTPPISVDEGLRRAAAGLAT